MAGIVVIIMATFYNVYIGRNLQKNYKLLMTAKDKRTKCANELFSSIKFIKMNALEEFFIARLRKARDVEMKILRSRFMINGLSTISIWMSPVLVVNATFAMFIYLGNKINAENAFSMISLF